MSLTPEQAAQGTPDAAAVRAQIARIRGSQEFGEGSRLSRLLTFVIEEELAGRGDRLKAFAIATEVFGRGNTFDPSQDSIVRVEMARLRTALKLYYARETDEALSVDIPKGGYRPVVRANAAPPALEAIPSPPEPGPRPAGRSLGRGWMAAAFTLAAVAGVGMWLGRETPAEPGAPLLLVAPVVISSSDPAVGALERGLQGELVAELSANAWLSVAYHTDGERALSAGRGRRTVYTVLLNIVVENGSYSMVSTLSDASSGAVLWSHRDAGMLAGGQLFPTLLASSQRIASELARPRGVVARAELAELGLQPAGAGTYACLLRFRQFEVERSAANRAGFLRCAEAQGAAGIDPTALGLVLHARLERAFLAGGEERAALLAAVQDGLRGAGAEARRRYIVQSAALRLAACQADARELNAMQAELTAQRANDPAVHNELALAHAFAFNDMEAARALSARARELALEPQPDADATEWLEALGARDGARLGTLLAARPRQPPGPFVALLRLAAAGMTGDTGGAADASRRLAELGMPALPEIERFIAGACWREETQRLVLADIRRALTRS